MVLEYNLGASVDDGPMRAFSDAQIFGALAGVMGGKSERELMALADRLERWAGASQR